MICRVIWWRNGMVMVFDEMGQQMSEYQGPWPEAKQKILNDAPAHAYFEKGEWRKGNLISITRDEFASIEDAGMETK